MFRYARVMVIGASGDLKYLISIQTSHNVYSLPSGKKKHSPPTHKVKLHSVSTIRDIPLSCFVFVTIDTLRSSEQSFSHVGTGISGLNQY